MNNPAPHNRTITAADKAAAARLKALWQDHKRRNGGRPTQDQLAEAYGEGANQSLISQYMNGRIALNAKAVRFFARELGVPPSAIREDLDDLTLAEPDTGLRLTRLENDVYAISLALSALVTAMARHRPAEAQDAAQHARDQAPPQYLDRGLVAALLEVLEGRPPTAQSGRPAA